MRFRENRKISLGYHDADNPMDIPKATMFQNNPAFILNNGNLSWLSPKLLGK
jgi:hypothetical protein